MVWVQESESSLHFKLAFVGGGAPEIVSYVAAKFPDSHVENLDDGDLRRTYACVSPDPGFLDGMQMFFHINGYDAPRAGLHADLADIDGAVIVIDARRLTLTWVVANQLLLTDLAARAEDWDSLARVIQVNRDADDPVETSELQELLGDQGLTWIESTPSSGHGVFDTMTALVRQVLRAYKAGTLAHFVPKS